LTKISSIVWNATILEKMSCLGQQPLMDKA